MILLSSELQKSAYVSERIPFVNIMNTGGEIISLFRKEITGGASAPNLDMRTWNNNGLVPFQN